MKRSLQIHPSQLETVQKVFNANGHTNQADFAAAIELHEDTVRKIFQGKPVNRRSFMVFCEALGLDHSDMIQEPTATNSTSGTQINQSVENNHGFMIGTVGTLNQNNSDKGC